MTRLTRPILAAAAMALSLGMLGAGLTTAPASPTEPSTTGLQVKFENDRVRVLEPRLQPGEREAQHAHPQYVLYALTDYRVRNTNADGTTSLSAAGDVFWGNP
jgi:hypothetical protein